MRSGEREVETGWEGREGVSKEEGRGRGREGGGSVCVFSLLGRTASGRLAQEGWAGKHQGGA